MTVNEAIAKGATEIRKPIWAFKDDRVLLPLGPDKFVRAVLYSPQSALAGMPDIAVQIIPWGDVGESDWEIYSCVESE